ncbi:MAG: CBS and ACT domain-containing protein [Nitrospinaceae bacterium]|nr:CBS and ACT domain-containing protein [Nitrospinaceae bacterium]
MIVEDVMVTKPFTIKKDKSLIDAQKTMVKHSIRHLPVVERGKLIGIITESDIRGAFTNQKPNGKMESAPGKMKIEDHMTLGPLTVHKETNIEDAALTIYQNKIGALPVVENNKLVGIISIMDMLGLFIDMMGILHSSSRIDVAIGSNEKDLKKVTKIITDHDLSIISVDVASDEYDCKKEVYAFRLDLCETQIVVDEIEQAGFKVMAALD